MFTLVANVVLLEPEEEGQPIKQVHVREPLSERRFTKVSNRVEGGGGGANLRVPERRVIGEKVVDGNDVVGFIFGTGPSRSGTRRMTVAKTHSIGSETVKVQYWIRVAESGFSGE